MKQKRRAISIREKREIIDEVEGGESVAQVAERRGLTRSTVYTILKRKDNLGTEQQRHPERQRVRGGKHIEVEAQLRKMIQDGKLLPKQAKICFLAKEMGIEASNGWYDRFRKRNFDLFPSTLKGTRDAQARATRSTTPVKVDSPSSRHGPHDTELDPSQCLAGSVAISPSGDGSESQPRSTPSSSFTTIGIPAERYDHEEYEVITGITDGDWLKIGRWRPVWGETEDGDDSASALERIAKLAGEEVEELSRKLEDAKQAKASALNKLRQLEQNESNEGEEEGGSLSST